MWTNDQEIFFIIGDRYETKYEVNLKQLTSDLNTMLISHSNFFFQIVRKVLFKKLNRNQNEKQITFVRIFPIYTVQWRILSRYLCSFTLSI